MPTVDVHCNNDKIWNLPKLIGFLSRHQHGRVTINVNPEAPDLSAVGLYDILEKFQFESVEINTHNPFEQHGIYHINIKVGNEFLSHTPIINHSNHRWNRERIFMTLFGRPTAARLAIAAHLYQCHRECSHIHFNSLPNDDNIELFEFDKLAQYEKSMLGPVAELVQNLPMTILPSKYDDFIKENIKTKGHAWITQIVEDPLTECYQDIFVDCVSESHVMGRTFFPTEKTTRPIWCKKPFVMFASKNYLAYLRQQGFRTFGDFWDETYDGYEGRERFLRIQDLIDWIAGHSRDQLETMYWDMQYTLDHNYNLLLKQNYNNQLTELS